MSTATSTSTNNTPAYLVNVLRREVDLERQDADVLRPSSPVSPVLAASVEMKVAAGGHGGQVGLYVNASVVPVLSTSSSLVIPAFRPREVQLVRLRLRLR